MKTSASPTIGVIFITHTAKKHLPHCLPPFLESPLRPRVLVVNSSSNDGTVELAKELGAETLVVPRAEFNHGTTREKARKHLGTDLVVMVTPDAYAQDRHTLEALVRPLLEGNASIAYARQIPHVGADFFEAFHREFNYPLEGHIRGIEDAGRYGVYTFFCSNSCAAYVNGALDLVGGFPCGVLLGEDTVAVANLLHRGHKVAYVAEAVVRHSHRYSLLEEFRRTFDTGLARKGYRHLIAAGGKDSERGGEYVKCMTKRLWAEKPLLLPYAAAQTLVRLLGYRIGERSAKAPLWFKRALSSQDFFWK